MRVEVQGLQSEIIMMSDEGADEVADEVAEEVADEVADDVLTG